MKHLILFSIFLFSISLLAQEKPAPTKVVKSKNCTVKVVEGCTGMKALIIFNCTNGEGLKCVDRNGTFLNRFTDDKITFQSVEMSINLHSGVMGDGPNTPYECQSKAQDCITINVK